ncbi:IclR family transcriptional regulator C-terminal domain-containing protein [uncultured Sphingomonas sp.]|uniref:IclR family transcriptional regulator domain-containing protein n=1 Tax=uncultured Sphingomonas sp. TaxID=158754 RepID=UPI0035CC806D
MIEPQRRALEDRETIAGLARGLAVIRAFGANGPTSTLSEIARAAGLSPAVARRCLHTLEALGYAGRFGRQFFLRPRVLDLASPYLSNVNGEALARDYLGEVLAVSGASSSLSVLDGADIVYLAHVGAQRLLRLEASIGTRFPAYATSMGRVLLAGLPEGELDAYFEAVAPRKLTPKTVVDVPTLRVLIAEVAGAGLSCVSDELATGVLSIAVPVYDRDGRSVAAINCSAHSGETTARELKRHVPMLQETARRISTALPHFPALTQPPRPYGARAADA